MKRTGFKIKPRKPLKRSALKKISPNKVKKVKLAGHPTVRELKDDIQSLLRQIVIKRDKKCILHGIRCYHEYGVDGVVWQAEHLIERSNSATFADHRLVVLVCKNCHGWKHFKKSNHDQYDKWVKSVLPKERVALWEACEESSWRPHRTGAFDWKLAKLALESELHKMK